MSSRLPARVFRTLAFYRDEFALVVLALAWQALATGVAVPGLTVAQERALIVRIADVRAVATADVQPVVRHTAPAFAYGDRVPNVTFVMPALPVPELQATRAATRLPAPTLAPGRVEPVRVLPSSSDSALRETLERARVEARVRGAVARALAAEHAARRVTVDAVN